MEKRSIFLIVFSVVGLIAISVIDGFKTSETLQWICLGIYIVVILITLYLPMKKEEKPKKEQKGKSKPKQK